MRQTQKFLGWLAIISLGFTMFTDAGWAETQLDTTFGENGVIFKDFLKGDDEIFALAPQADGKIVVVGQYYNGAVKNLAVARYLPTGELDTAFNDDGIFTESIGTGDTVAGSLAIQGDGKIVVAGSTTGGANNIVVLRLTKEGFQDKAFADNGQLLVPITDGEANAYEVQTTSEGAIFVTGTVTKAANAGTYGKIVKLTEDGSYAADFGKVGVALVQYPYNVEIRAAALQTDGKIVVAGSFAPGGTTVAGLLRLDQNGLVDETFGEKGQALLSLEGTGALVNDLTVDSTGRLLVAGEVNNGSHLESFAGRLSQDGFIDSAFATAGVYRNSSPSANTGKAIVLQTDGAILVVGFATTTKKNDVFILTLKEDTTDLTKSKILATNITADLAGLDDVGNAVAVMPDGFVYVAGSTVKSDNKDFALMRFIGGVALNAAAGEGIAAEGVSTAGYTLTTKAVTDITRVGAVSGGKITDYGTSSCTDSCNATCSTSTSATCFSSCFSTCKLPTISLRGVVYGVNANPVYIENANQETSTNSTSSETTSSITDIPTIGGTTTTIGTGTSTTSSSNDSIFPASGSFAYDIVRSGQTEDGKGTGSYTSDIQEITPNTLYYLRAYAVLSDGTVIYGNEITFKTNDACFIATAAFGSLLDGHVTILREFRDRVLMVSWVGQQLVGKYYGFSPRVADFISHHETLRTIVRLFLIPLVLLAYFILKTGFGTQLFVLAAVFCISIVISNKSLRRRLYLYEK
jgi:uncharacterized delta-60 repeat protein